MMLLNPYVASVRTAAVEAMKEAGCCDLTMNRILKGGEKPGALWHIFDPQDSDKIRDLIHKVNDYVDL